MVHVHFCYTSLVLINCSYFFSVLNVSWVLHGSLFCGCVANYKRAKPWILKTRHYNFERNVLNIEMTS
jgi:hypothetical protein